MVMQAPSAEPTLKGEKNNSSEHTGEPVHSPFTSYSQGLWASLSHLMNVETEV